MKKSRLGSDPLSWIGKKEGKAKDGKRDKQSKPSKQSKQRKQAKQNLQKEQKKKTSQKGLPDGWTRATFIVKEEHLKKLKALAYWDRKQIKEVINEIIEIYLKDKKVKLIK